MMPAPTAEQQQRARVVAGHDRGGGAEGGRAAEVGQGELCGAQERPQKQRRPQARACFWRVNRPLNSQPSLPRGWWASRACHRREEQSRRAERRSRYGDGVRSRSTAGLRPDREASGPLLSTIDYATNPASTGYGKGIELRLESGELEFRWADRFPAYSIRVRSDGAGIRAGQWTHIALVYSGRRFKG